jgi:diguanylate cyclase (GGDEF)-like protein
MATTRRHSWGTSEFYELLCLMMMGSCLWIVGGQLELFPLLGEFIFRHGLFDLVLLGFCMSAGVFAAAIRKSLQLRREMLARDAAENLAEAIARHDPLTGLANRRLFSEAVTAKLNRADHLCAVLLIDIDRFKAVNDAHGHPAGDALLCVVADRLRSILPQGGLAARLGGDEFVALVDYEGDNAGLIALAQDMIAALSAPTTWNGVQLEVGATVGIALAPADGGDAESLLYAADLAMYRGKQEGRGTFRFFEAAMDQALKARIQLERELRSAVRNGEIEPYYQPIVGLPDKELLGFEVLARWRHPTRGVLAPTHFIEAAEQMGLMAELSYGLLRQACLHAKNWPAHLRLAVNISPKQLQERCLPEQILSILTEAGFAPGRLEVEVTETALIENIEVARSVLTSLQNLGVRIALDDFGTGYSSLYHLRELRFDKIRIDRSYVQSLLDSPESVKIVDAIIGLGKSLDLSTTAEGIETVAHLKWLASQGCSFGQGYLFGAPMPASAADKLFQQAGCIEASVEATGPAAAAA